MVGLENFELAGIKSYTRFWGLLMFGSYSVINVIVLLNLLIAMMSNSYAMITEHSDVEWKFARTRLWMSYFEGSATLPPPFNILPTPKLVCKLLGLREKDKIRKMQKQETKEKEQDIRYSAVMRAVVWRYISAMHRKVDEEPVTEDDVIELKGDVSALRYELLEVFERNGMDVSFTDRKEKAILGKRMKMERRLMKDFHVGPVADEDILEEESGLSKFWRLAKMAVAKPSAASVKWDQTLVQAGVSTQIGRCRNRDSFKNQQNLLRAMDEAKKLVMRSPLKVSRVPSPSDMPMTTSGHLLELINDISTEVGEPIDPTKSHWKPDPPSPLKSKKMSGESPPKVSAPPTPDEDISVARPVVPDIKPAEGALPPPRLPVKAKAPATPTMEVTPSSPTERKSPSPIPSPLPSSKPSGSLKSTGSPKPPESPKPPGSPKPPESPIPPGSPSSISLTSKAHFPSKSSSPEPETLSTRSVSPARTALRGTPSPPLSGRLTPTTSTEHLISKSPEPLRHSNMQSIKPAKRIQPKTGWL